MPMVSVKKSALDRALGRTYDEDGFDQLCFSYGLELDEVVTEENGEQTYKVELPANRYDLLCVEGLARALRVFLRLQDPPHYAKVPAAQPQRLVIKPQVGCVRPHCVAAVLRCVRLDADAYASFIDLQDKLHQNLGRRRSLVAIGTHDLDTLKGPFVYTAEKPTDIKFRPLNQSKEFTAVELMELYSTDSQLKAYLPIIRHEPLYPVIYDAGGVLLSMPPIINGDHSKITQCTRNIFIECTATDLNKASVVLDTIVTMFSQYCATPFTVEPVEVQRADGTLALYPELPYREERLLAADISRTVGMDIPPAEMAELLTAMCLGAEVVDDGGDELRVTVPPTRHDIVHACDMAEDVAIAYGYNRIERRLPQSANVAEQCGLNALGDKLRAELAQAGYTEALTFSLCSECDVSTRLRRPGLLARCVRVSNPKTGDFELCRPSLLAGLLATVRHNQHMALPLRLFELQDVVLKDDACEVGARNHRRLAAVHCGKTAGVEHVHGLLDRVMTLLDVPADAQRGYSLRADDADGAYLPGRSASVLHKGGVIGRLGAVHPAVTAAFELPIVAAALEIDIEPFL